MAGKNGETESQGRRGGKVNIPQDKTNPIKSDPKGGPKYTPKFIGRITGRK